MRTFAIIFCLCSCSLLAQQDIRFGVSASFGRTFHIAQFLAVPGSAIIPTIDSIALNLNTDYRFQSGGGFAWSAGGFVEMQLSPLFNMSLHTSLTGNDGTMLSNELSSLAGRSDGSITTLRSVRRCDVSLQTAGLDILFGINPLAGFNLYLGLRGDLAYLKRYSLREELVAPSDGTFFGGLRTQNEESRTLDGVRNLGIANFNAALLGGIGYEISLGNARAWSLEPRLMGSVGLFDIVQNMAQNNEYWRVNALRGGVALRYYPQRAVEFNEQEFKIKQLQLLEKQVALERAKIQEQLQEIKQSGLLVKLSNLVGVSADGTTSANPSIRVEEFRATRTIDLLPLIFFNESSSVIPARYRRLLVGEQKRFSPENLANATPVQIYQNLLNIIGRRLQERPEASITLVGMASPQEASGSTEKNDRARKLARGRAEAVADYLKEVWQLASERITIQERETPPQTATSDALSSDVLRYVEVSSNDPAIVEPLTLGTKYRTVEPSAIQMDVNILAGEGLKQWNLEISQANGSETEVLKAFGGKSDFPRQCTWVIGESQQSIPTASGTVDIALTVTDQTNRSGDSPIIALPVEVVSIAEKNRLQKGDKRIDEFIIGEAAPLEMLTDKPSTPLTRAIYAKLKDAAQKRSTLIVESRASGNASQRSVVSLLSAFGRDLQIKEIQAGGGQNVAGQNKGGQILPEDLFYQRGVVVRVQTEIER